MCGIVGYTGKMNASQLLLEGLKRLEYRGYDSAGVTLFENGEMKTVKAKGRIAELEQKLADCPVQSHCGIAHTRWATHGIPSDVNSHPHVAGKVSLVHNGIIENYLDIKAFLEGQGINLCSQTDTEMASALINHYYKGDPMEAIIKAVDMLEGSYAFGIVFADFPEDVFGVRKGSPLIAAVADDGLFIASDIAAVLSQTRQYYMVGEDEMVRLSGGKPYFYTKNGTEIEKELQLSSLTLEQAEKEGYEHFMLKEIHEQPSALRATLMPRIAYGVPSFQHDLIDTDFFAQFDCMQIVACGSAYYAGCVGKHIIEKFCRIPVITEIASEFRYRNPILTPKTLVIIISQSGETADSLAALRYAKEHGVKTLAIVNVTDSSIGREADKVIYTYAGPEISVATTKAYSVQVGILYLIAIQTAMAIGRTTSQQASVCVRGLLDTVEKIEQTFALEKDCKEIAASLTEVQSMFYIGRGQDYSMSLEGALKLKEISYIHCEAYAAGELKHGTISLITENTPVIAIATDAALAPKTISNIKEIKARGGYIIGICTAGNPLPDDAYDRLIVLPEVESEFAPILATIPLQLLAYHTAVARGCDVDKPRNLAKSVTVE